MSLPVKDTKEEDEFLFRNGRLRRLFILLSPREAFMYGDPLPKRPGL